MHTPSSTTSTKADGFRRVEVITGVGRRRRWSDDEKARIVAESLDPATTSSAVARRYGLHVSQLFTWRQQLQRRASSVETSGTPGFVPVLLAEDSAVPAETVGRSFVAGAKADRRPEEEGAMASSSSTSPGFGRGR